MSEPLTMQQLEEIEKRAVGYQPIDRRTVLKLVAEVRRQRDLILKIYEHVTPEKVGPDVWKWLEAEF